MTAHLVSMVIVVKTFAVLTGMGKTVWNFVGVKMKPYVTQLMVTAHVMLVTMETVVKWSALPVSMDKTVGVDAIVERIAVIM